MFKFIKSGVDYPQRRHPSMEDQLRNQMRKMAQPGIGKAAVITSWDDSFRTLPMGGLFFTALNQRACILVSLSEENFPYPEIVTKVLESKRQWVLHFAAFLQARHPILCANLALPANPFKPVWLEAPLDLSDGDVQDFCEALLIDETIDIIIKHQSYAEGYYSVAFSAHGISGLLKKEIRSVTQNFKPGLTRNDFSTAYILLQKTLPSDLAGIEANKCVALKIVSKARNTHIHFDPYETPEKRVERERKEEEHEREQDQQEIQNYVKKLLSIKNVLDFGAGTAECKALGMEINQRWGFQGMVAVVEFIQDYYDGEKARYIEIAWDGIGEWMG